MGMIKTAPGLAMNKYRDERDPGEKRRGGSPPVSLSDSSGRPERGVGGAKRFLILFGLE